MFNTLLEIVNSGVIDNPSSENDLDVIIKPMSQIDMNSFYIGLIAGIIGTAIIATMIILAILKYKK